MSLPRFPFWFLRHGETDYNAAGLSQGALDIALNATGRAQAAAAAPLLAGQGITSIIASPLLRARETAEIVNEFLRLPLAFEPGLHEVQFGGMEGKPLLPWFPEWLEGRFTPPNAETFGQVLSRIDLAMARILCPGPLLIVAHGGVFRALRDLMNLPKQGLTPNAVPLYCTPAGTGWQVAEAS
jgi:broad specificity phosphatase PhoE